LFLKPLLTIFQLNRGRQFYWWRKPEQNGNLVINGEFHIIRRRSVDNFSPHVLIQTEETYNFGTDYRDIPGK
jgi:hypothetical protein